MSGRNGEGDAQADVIDVAGRQQPVDVQDVPPPDAPASEDPKAFQDIRLTRGQVGNNACVELHVHGEKLSGRGGQMVPVSRLLARVTADALTMFPLVAASYRKEFLEPKYKRLKEIVFVADEFLPWELPESVEAFDEMLAGLPTGFGRHAKFGLGLLWEYRLIPEAIVEKAGVTRLVVEPGDGASVTLPEFRLGVDRFTSIRKAIDAITSKATSRSLRDRQLAAYNETLGIALPAEFPRRLPEIRPGEIYELVQLGRRNPNRNARDSLAAAQLVEDDAERIAAEQPEELLRLKAVIEQVTLKELIAKFESMLGGNLAEARWQAFFKQNPFILSLAFSHPVILLQDQASVGGATIRGNGESIVDFLMKHHFTGNLALVEIKRPSADLVESRPYRGDLHAPHRELTASMAQVLDQRAQLLHHFAVKKSQDPALDNTYTSSIACIVIIGTVPSDGAQKRSLDLFRHSSKDVVVITFDELLEKLRSLHRLMLADSESAPASAGDTGET